MKQETYKYYSEAVDALLDVQKILGGKFVCRPDQKMVNGKRTFKKSHRISKIGHWGYLLCEKKQIQINIKNDDYSLRSKFYFEIKQVV